MPTIRGFPHPRTETVSPVAPALQADYLPLSHWENLPSCDK